MKRLASLAETAGGFDTSLRRIAKYGTNKMGERVSYTMAEDEMANAERCVEDRVLIFTL